MQKHITAPNNVRCNTVRILEDGHDGKNKVQCRQNIKT
jgi:hypothetical protein